MTRDLALWTSRGMWVQSWLKKLQMSLDKGQMALTKSCTSPEKAMMLYVFWILTRWNLFFYSWHLCGWVSKLWGNSFIFLVICLPLQEILTWIEKLIHTVKQPYDFSPVGCRLSNTFDRFLPDLESLQYNLLNVYWRLVPTFSLFIVGRIKPVQQLCFITALSQCHNTAVVI